MTDRIKTLTVVLDKEYRDDDCESIANAIRMIKGVLSVGMDVCESADYWAMERVKSDLTDKLWEVIHPKAG